MKAKSIRTALEIIHPILDIEDCLLPLGKAVLIWKLLWKSNIQFLTKKHDISPYRKSKGSDFAEIIVRLLSAVTFLAGLDEVQEELLYYPRRWRCR